MTEKMVLLTSANIRSMADPDEAPKKKDSRQGTAEAIERAVTSDDVQKLYANGFALGMGNSDVMIVFNRFGGKPVAIVNLSYTLAKTLAQRMGTLVAEFEQTIGQDILTTDRVDEAVKAAKQAKSERSEDASQDENIH